MHECLVRAYCLKAGSVKWDVRRQHGFDRYLLCAQQTRVSIQTTGTEAGLGGLGTYQIGSSAVYTISLSSPFQWHCLSGMVSVFTAE